MDGTIFGVEIRTLIAGLVVSWSILISLVAIFFKLWRKEMYWRKVEMDKLLKEARNLLDDIESSFSQEIFLAVGQIVETMDGIIPDFERGRYSIILSNLTSELLKGFSDSILFELCGHLNKLSAEINKGTGIKNIHSESENAKIGNFISSISDLIESTRALISDYKVESIYSAIAQCAKRDMLINGFRNNKEELRKCVSELNKSKEE
ncbi:hypothetical protein J7J13_00585 [bacterium]|nr:hypothetical protein [bacterium]